MKYIHTPEASAGGRFLARKLGLRRIRVPIHAYPRRATVVLNWGGNFQGDPDSLPMIRVINPPFRQRAAAHKLACFSMLDDAGVASVPHTADPHEAIEWLRQGSAVVERRTVTGSGGAGIRVVRPTDFLREAPLYTRFIPSVREYRVHVIGSATLPARKAKRNNAPEQEFPIRNHGDTWTFQYTIPENIPVPESVLTLAKRAIDAVGLDFGAVDILYEGRGNARVLEINTAPGIDHSVAEEFYVRELQGLVNGQA